MDRDLAALQWLCDATRGLWSGENTQRETLRAAVEFCEEWQRGVLTRAHDAVSQGACGDYLQDQYGRLLEQARLDGQIAGYERLRDATGGLWRGIETDQRDAEAAAEVMQTIARVLPAIADTTDTIACARAAIEELCLSRTSADHLREVAGRFTAETAALEDSIDATTRSGMFSEEGKRLVEALGTDELVAHCETITAAGPKLQRWCSWCSVREEAEASGLGGFVSALLSGVLAPTDVRNSFETNYSRWWLDHVVSADEVLRTFISAEHEQRIAAFRALDDRYTVLTRDYIRARLAAAVPSADAAPRGSGWGTLQRELKKKRRQMPLRELMSQIPEVVTGLTPCLLMSPLSIAQYLTVSAATFDVVVFDEASQIPVWDAIGAIARAKQVVMVGDPKQLPPTNFFNRADAEDELDDVPEDLESILDECLGANLPHIQLTWHYRSRHESLIAFSNRRYYDGRLVTFPSPITDDRAVSVDYVPGVYEKGGARTNPIEAKALVRDIVLRLKSPGFGESGLSIGVVTFNAEQQKLIEDLLDNERRKDPSLERFFAETLLEPVFVKNLESVQGDERDVMYFFITYGPDLGPDLDELRPVESRRRRAPAERRDHPRETPAEGVLQPSRRADRPRTNAGHGRLRTEALPRVRRTRPPRLRGSGFGQPRWFREPVRRAGGKGA